MAITGKIDVKKIDKSKLYVGAKGTYLDIVLIETTNNAYGDDYMIVQGVSQEDRLAGIKGAILGNAKIRGQQQAPRPAAPKAAAPAPTENLDGDPDQVPF